jgi:hypothetical protein
MSWQPPNREFQRTVMDNAPSHRRRRAAFEPGR